MKGFFLTTAVLFFTALNVSAQIAKDFMVGGGFDLIKTDNDGFLGKGQFATEGHYFVTRQFTLSSGLEVWTDEGVSLSLGARWFPVEEAFVRMRGLIGENDLVIGGGWTKPVNENLRFEAMADFYFEGEFAIRAGLMYVIRRK
ncbi:hypothetical protein [Pseudochryseolinea flava]|uniref:Outer membrane protein beta-barrel domain-containing protein n=1 Tax=Pseudochryseolinea flava TaxID=2059302 RepID=A0A364XU50_9BACT|nr:hypothetical protein [Pseudochryseolinea flava]RAV97688.1 hypothetical protein DQQ10_27255 [Pseudochryseolinea flava]